MSIVSDIETMITASAEQIGINNEGFKALSLRDRCLGLAVFAHAAGDRKAEDSFRSLYGNLVYLGFGE